MMALSRGTGVVLVIALGAVAAGGAAAQRFGWVHQARVALGFARPGVVRLTAGDFPAGTSAPVGEMASIPLRPTRIGFTPRGSSASILLAVGGVEPGDPEHSANQTWDGIMGTAYALDARAVIYSREEDLVAALALGGERGGIDLAAMSVDRVAAWAHSLRDAAPRVLALAGRSQGQEALAAVGTAELIGLRGKRLAAYPGSSAYFFALWALSRAGLAVDDVRWVELPSALDAGRALREGRADAAAGLYGDVELAAADRGGKVLVTTADAPHLVATVLVARGDFAARYPDAVRRALRGLLDAAGAVQKDPSAGAQRLGEVAPYLGDPTEAIRSAPPATLSDNLAFFGLAGEAPVTYDELYESAAAIFRRLGRVRVTVPAEETRALGALRYVAEARGP